MPPPNNTHGGETSGSAQITFDGNGVSWSGTVTTTTADGGSASLSISGGGGSGPRVDIRVHKLLP